MKLHEYQAKRIFARYGIPVPQGEVAANPIEAELIAEKLGVKVVVKSQVLVGGRGKAGGIKLAENPAEAVEMAEKILGMKIKGLIVQKVLVEEASAIQNEIYLAIVIDRAVRKPILIASSEGGVEIEEVAKTNPEAIKRLTIDPLMGLLDFQARDMAFELGMRGKSINDFVRIAKGLYRAFTKSDAGLAEINPLIINDDGSLVAVDAKMDLDDNALYRQQELAEQRDIQEETETEREARLAGLSYIQLDGEIGCMVNGAGLAMATMDVVKHYGGSPANFLDIGGGASSEKVATALRLILADSKVKAVLFNIFGGITRCDVVARGILSALEEVKPDIPMVVRLAGTNEEEGRAILAEANLPSAGSFGEAAQTAVALAKGGSAS